MSIEIIVLTFCQKPLEMAGFLTLLKKAPPLTWQKAGPEAVLFAFLWLSRAGLPLIYWVSLFYWGNRYIASAYSHPALNGHATKNLKKHIDIYQSVAYNNIEEHGYEVR